MATPLSLSFLSQEMKSELPSSADPIGQAGGERLVWGPWLGPTYIQGFLGGMWGPSSTSPPRALELWH